MQKLKTKATNCTNCGESFQAVLINRGPGAKCPACRPEPQVVRVDDHPDTLMEIGCLAEMLRVDEAFLKGLSKRNYGGTALFTAEQANAITRRVEAARAAA